MARLSPHVTKAKLTFERLLDIAEEVEALGKQMGAAVGAQLAAQVAWRNHAGFLGSPRLERLLLRLGERIPTSRFGSADDAEVVHVLSRANGMSGDTRFVWRWVQLDDSHRHSVVLTRQLGNRYPRLFRKQ